jgi:hypothetical protein
VRRIILTCALLALALALALPAATAARTNAPDDGTLVIKDGNVDPLVIQAKGGVVGRFDQGLLVVKDFNPDDDVDPVVTGAGATKVVSDFTTRYSGKNIRFRFIGGRFTIKIIGGVGVDLSAVGQGTVIVGGAGTLDDGSYSVNGGPFHNVPLLPRTFDLQAS